MSSIDAPRRAISPMWRTARRLLGNTGSPPRKFSRGGDPRADGSTWTFACNATPSFHPNDSLAFAMNLANGDVPAITNVVATTPGAVLSSPSKAMRCAPLRMGSADHARCVRRVADRQCAASAIVGATLYPLIPMLTVEFWPSRKSRPTAPAS